MTIRLHKRSQVEIWDISATVAFGQDRPEFLAVARLAIDLEEQGILLEPQVICDELLGHLPEAFGWRILERCEALGLLQRSRSFGQKERWSITDEGREALERERVLVPQHGIFRFWVSDEPLLPSPVVHVTLAPEISAQAEYRKVKSSQREGLRNIDRQGQMLPHILRQRAFGQRFPLLADGRACRLDDLEDRGVSIAWPGSSTEVEICLSIPPGGVEERRLSYQVSLQETQNARERTLHLTLPCDERFSLHSYDEIWDELVSQGSWNENGVYRAMDLAGWRRRFGRSCILARFDDTSPAERRQFLRRVKVQEPSLSEHTFAPTEIEGASLVASDEREAQRWCDWLLRDGISDYLTLAELLQHGERIASRFTGEYQGVRPRSHEELFADAQADLPYDPNAWLLLAARDLGLWEGEHV